MIGVLFWVLFGVGLVVLFVVKVFSYFGKQMKNSRIQKARRKITEKGGCLCPYMLVSFAYS